MIRTTFVGSWPPDAQFSADLEEYRIKREAMVQAAHSYREAR